MQDTEVKQISLDLIDDPQIAMRQDLDDPELDQLMSDMREVGLLEPIVLRRIGDRYEVIAGHRRTRAARLLRWLTIESKIVQASDEEAFTMRVIENLSRKDVDPVDEAVFVGEIMLRHHKEPPEIARIVRRSQTWVEERLEIFNMPDLMKGHLKARRYPLGAALWIFRIENERERMTYATWAATNGVSVAGAKQWYLLAKARNFAPQSTDVEIRDESGAPPQIRRVTTCAKCGSDVFLDEADSVWVHRACPSHPP